MTKKILRKTSNPKKPEEYLKMFDKYVKLTKDIKDSSSFLIDDIDQIKPSITNSFDLVKNDRIESYLKFYRAFLCQRFIDLYEGEDAEEAKKYCKKELESYFNKVEKDREEIEGGKLLDFDFAELVHFIDLYNSDKNVYRKIGEYSWTNKTMLKVLHELAGLEHEIDSKKKFSKQEYERQLSRAQSTEEYLKIDSRYTWYIIESNSCQFEAYLNEHCGTDRAADVLFSLRSKDVEGFFDSHVTISASIKTVDKDKNNTPAVFIVKQVKGKGNTTPNSRYWPAIIKLFLEDEFGWQEVGSYKPEDDFHIDDLDEKDKKKFLEIKPWWNNIFLALKHYDLFKDERNFTASNWGAKEAYFDDKNNFVIVYHSFGEMISEIFKHWGDRGRDNIIKQAKYYTEDYFPDIEVRKKDIPYDDFFLWIKNKMKKTYNNIVECMETEGLTEIGELAEYEPDVFSSIMVSHDGSYECKHYLAGILTIFESAYRTGLEVGTQSEAYREFKDYFDGLEFTYNGSVAGNFIEVNDLFHVVIFNEALVESFNENGQLFVPTPDRDSFEPPRRSIEWDIEFDEDAAYERLVEELPS